MLSEQVLRSGLRRYWGLDDVTVAVHNGGMGSATWFIGHDGGRWVAKAVAAALAALDAADPDRMSWGLLHADPAPEAFRLDPPTGRCGVIDWSYFLRGPLLYDLASAVMYIGGPAHAGDLIEAYLDQGMVTHAEIQHGLAVMLRFRWAVQADYFAWRIAHNDLTGTSGPEDNEKGLEDARRSPTFRCVDQCHPSGE